MKAKILATLVCLVLVATALPSVSATAVTLTTVTDPDIYVFGNYNYTAADIGEIFGLSLDKDDTLYLGYYNTTEVYTTTSITPTEDSDDVAWFDINISDKHATNAHAYFADEAIADEDTAQDEGTEALLINETYSTSKYVFIVTIPDGVTFTVDKHSFLYDDENFTVYNDKGKETGNVSSWNATNYSGVYTMDINSSSTSHQIVVVDDEIHATATAVAGKRITAAKWYWFDTATAYSMNTEATSDYNILSSEDGYVAFNIYKDSGLFSKYIGGKTAFRMTTDSLTYESTPWYKFWGSDWTPITTHSSVWDGIGIGLIEYIYKVDGSGDAVDVITRENYGVVTAVGATASSAGMDYLTCGTTRIPKVIVDDGKVLF